MNKLFSKIATLSVGLAMAVGVGVALGHQGVREVRAAEGDTLLSFSSAAVVGGTATSYTSYSDDDWELNIGGNKVSAGWNKTAANARQVGSTYAIDSTSVTATTYGWVASTKAAVAKAGKLEFSYTGGSGNGSGKLWLGYSTDGGVSYSKVTLKSGTQGSSCGSTNTTYTFEFDTIGSAYYAIIVTGGTSGSAFRFDSVTATLKEGASVDPSLKTMAIYESDNPAEGSTYQWSATAGIYHFVAKEDSATVSGVTWSVSDTTVATIDASTGYLTTVKPGNVTVFAEASGYNKASAAITIWESWLEELTITGSMTKTSYYVGESWNPAGLVVTASYHSGWEADVTSEVEWSYNPASPALNVTSVVATATLSGEDPVSSPAQAVSVTRTNPIQVLYTQSSGASVDVYGVYVGFLDGTGPVIMDGAYGIVVYNKTADVSGYTEGTTILHVTGSISIYKGLYEIGSATISVASGTYDAPETPVVYATAGGETADYASRLTTVTGTPSLVSGSFDDAAGTADIKMNFAVSDKTIQVFYKKAAQTADAEAFAAIKAAVTNSEEITIKGFTGWYDGFQVQMNGYVKPAESYTAEDFAQDLLDQTDAVCTGWKEGDNNHDALVAIWSDLAANDKYPSLPTAQKNILAEAERDESGTVVEQAMARYDFLTGKYNLSNFINGRTPIVVAGSNFAPAFDDNNSYVIIAVISAVSVMSFGLALFLRKKRSK